MERGTEDREETVASAPAGGRRNPNYIFYLEGFLWQMKKERKRN